MNDHSALIFDATTDAYLQTLLHQGEVGSVAPSYDGTLALTGSNDHTAVLWGLNDASKINLFQHGNPVQAVALSPSGKISFTAAQGDLVALWNNATGERMHTFYEGPNHGVVISARFSSDETLLAVGHTHRLISLYDVQSGRIIQKWDPGTRHTMRATGAAVIEVGFSNDNRTLLAITGDDRLLELRRS